MWTSHKKPLFGYCHFRARFPGSEWTPVLHELGKDSSVYSGYPCVGWGKAPCCQGCSQLAWPTPRLHSQWHSSSCTLLHSSLKTCCLRANCFLPLCCLWHAEPSWEKSIKLAFLSLSDIYTAISDFPNVFPSLTLFLSGSKERADTWPSPPFIWVDQGVRKTQKLASLVKKFRQACGLSQRPEAQSLGISKKHCPKGQEI